MAAASLVTVIGILCVFTIGAVYYFFAIYEPPNPGSVNVQGEVAEPYSFVYSDYKIHEVTVRAELNGAVTHKPAMNYTGVPLSFVVGEANPDSNATRIVVRGTDGYTAEFLLAETMSDNELIMTFDNGLYNVVAAHYDGAYWVEDVASIEVN